MVSANIEFLKKQLLQNLHVIENKHDGGKFPLAQASAEALPAQTREPNANGISMMLSREASPERVPIKELVKLVPPNTEATPRLCTSDYQRERDNLV